MERQAGRFGGEGSRVCEWSGDDAVGGDACGKRTSGAVWGEDLGRGKNEMYGPWQWGHIQITQYPEKLNLIVKAM
jgi:hypothetical protein